MIKVSIIYSNNEGGNHFLLPLLFEDFEEVVKVLGSSVQSGVIKKIYFCLGGNKNEI